MKIVKAKITKGTLSMGLSLFILKYVYRNSYGEISSKDTYNEFGYTYPMHLTDNLNIPVSDYGFINRDTHQTFLGMMTEEELSKDNQTVEEVDYSKIPFNLGELQKRGLIKYIEKHLNMFNQMRDFDLVESCHKIDLFYKYYELKNEGKYTPELRILEGEEDTYKMMKIKPSKRYESIPPIMEYSKTEDLPINLISYLGDKGEGDIQYIKGTDYTLLDDKLGIKQENKLKNYNMG